LLFGFILRDGAVLMRVVEALAHFIEDIEVVLDVLQGAVLREFVEERLDLLLGRGHAGVRIA